jgi:hypothetical protein
MSIEQSEALDINTIHSTLGGDGTSTLHAITISPPASEGTDYARRSSVCVTKFFDKACPIAGQREEGRCIAQYWLW